VVNRVQPRFADDDQLASLPRLEGVGAAGDLAQLVDNLRGYTAASDREERAFAELVSKVTPAPVYRVPLLNTDVHDLEGLAHIADLLFSGSGVAGPAGATPAAPVSSPVQER
jgi:hypothetical protein